MDRREAARAKASLLLRVLATPPKTNFLADLMEHKVQNLKPRLLSGSLVGDRVKLGPQRLYPQGKGTRKSGPACTPSPAGTVEIGPPVLNRAERIQTISWEMDRGPSSHRCAAQILCITWVSQTLMYEFSLKWL